MATQPGSRHLTGAISVRIGGPFAAALQLGQAAENQPTTDGAGRRLVAEPGLCASGFNLTPVRHDWNDWNNWNDCGP